MNITGIITEYNIFHNSGHKYQIDEIKNTFGRSDCCNDAAASERAQDVAITGGGHAKAALSVVLTLLLNFLYVMR